MDTTPAIPPPDYDPLGFSSESPLAPKHLTPPTGEGMLETLGLPDRWRIGWPTWDRYGRQAPIDPILLNTFGGDSPYTAGHLFNPYDRNVLKGDYPIIGDDIFFSGLVATDTLVNWRKLPTPSGVSAEDPNSFDFFGDGEQRFISQSAILSAEMFQGNTAFRPVDWLVRITGVYNYNDITLRERNAANIDPTFEPERDDEFLALQELFYEQHLGDLSPRFDFAAVRAGRQLFVSDFRGFVFNDISDGVRLFGNANSNRVQYNVALFNQNEKDTNSELNEMHWREQQVLIANVYLQDFIWYGYTTQFSFHWNHDQSDFEYDDNGFLVIPGLLGDVRAHDIDAYYLGWTSDGHIERLNVSHAFYYVLGNDDYNNLAGREVDLAAYMAALELSVDIDWFRPKVSALYASGDEDPLDGTGEGFDGIFDNPFFAGGSSSFFQNQAFRLGGVDLVSGRSFYNDLAGTKAEGQANYVNPGTILLNAGFDAELTPKLRTSFNYNSIFFADTSTLELLLNQDAIDSHFGDEFNLLVQYRPMLNNNVIFTGGASVFLPGDGFEEIFEGDGPLYQLFMALTLSY